MGRGLDRREFLRRAALTAAALPWMARADAWGAWAVAPPLPAFHGIFPIMQTPFDENDQVDWEDLERETNFCVRAGTHGMVWPQLASEFYLLSEEERMRGAEVVIKAAAKRVPVVIGVQAPSTGIALKFARHAKDKGADALIALPPFMGHASLDAVGDYYRALVAAAVLPIFIQNSGPPWGPAMPASWVIQLAKAHPQLGYIKEEVEPVSERIGEYARSGALTSIFSGNASKNLLDELAHGAAGSMPASQFVDIDAEVYNLAAAGKLAEARALFEKLLPMINLEEIYGLHIVKAVLVRRGVFKTAKLRGVAGKGFDAIDEQELEAWWKPLAEHFKV